MTSQKKVETNRQNALRSTGPRTRKGKARVAQNAITHGLLSRETLLPDEDPEALESVVKAVRAAWDPQGPQEHFQVDLMIRTMWRLQRLGRVEAGIFASNQYSILAKRAAREADTCKFESLHAMVEAGHTITDRERYEQAMARAEHMTALGEEDSPTIGLTFIRGSSGADVFSKFQRYEATIERSYYRALHELQRLQQARLGAYVPPPLAVDVTVNGGADHARLPGAPDRAEEDALPETRHEAREP